MEKYFADLTKTDRESDSFRYPFHIVWEEDEWGMEGKFVVKLVFNEQIDIDLVKIANKFEAAYEIIQKWYKKETDSAAEWKDVKTIFIETGGYYYSQSVVGYKYSRAVFYPYTEAGNIKKLDEQFARGQAARGWRVGAQGWAIDKDGGISCWSITTKGPKAKSFLQKMSEKSEEIRQKQLEKAKDAKEEKEVFAMKKYKKSNAKKYY